MRYLVYFSIALLVASCQEKKKPSTAYFGGEIVNPNDRYVILYKNDEVVDSAKLDERNRFLIKLDKVSEGLYHFEHQPEYQYVFIEGGDSIMMRLNTLDFDESLVFSGKGAEKNNFIIDMFLVSEDEETLAYTYYDLQPAEFRHKMDSLLVMKEEQYKHLLEGNTLSENAKNIAQAAIKYPHYVRMELYPYMHKKRGNLKKFPVLPEDFYDYREQLYTNDPRLSYFRPYFTYMVMKINNLSYTACTQNCEDAVEDPQKTLHYHLHNLKLIDSLVKEPVLRSGLIRNTGRTYLLEDRDINNNQLFMEQFATYSIFEKCASEVIKLYKSIQQLQPGMPLPRVSLVTTDSTFVDSEKIFNTQPTVFYFWSVNQKNHLRNLKQRVEELQKKYPSYRFIGINMNDSHQKWIQVLQEERLNPQTQFRAAYYKKVSNQWVINSLNKVLIVGAKGNIIDAFGNINDKRLEDILMSKK